MCISLATPTSPIFIPRFFYAPYLYHCPRRTLTHSVFFFFSPSSSTLLLFLSLPPLSLFLSHSISGVAVIAAANFSCCSHDVTKQFNSMFDKCTDGSCHTCVYLSCNKICVNKIITKINFFCTRRDVLYIYVQKAKREEGLRNNKDKDRLKFDNERYKYEA
jgi:hypothetical protein